MGDNAWRPHWPLSSGELTQRRLKTLSDVEFDALIARIRRRERKFSKNKRHAERIAREVRIRRRRAFEEAQARPPAAPFPDHYNASDLLDSLEPRRRVIWKKFRDRQRKAVVDIKEFSFIDDPVGTVLKLAQIVKCECLNTELRINFLEQELRDVGPYLVLGLMRRQMAPVIRGGRINVVSQQMMEAAGLKDFLHMNFASQTENWTDVWPFELEEKVAQSLDAPNLPHSPARQEKVAERFGRTINTWLSKLNEPFELTDLGMSNVVRLIGEAIGNAERHSLPGKDGHWAIAGLMSRRIPENKNLFPGDSEFVCRVSILSLGQTVSETINDAVEPIIREDLEAYKNLFTAHQLGSRQAEELATVYALQDGVTCRDQKVFGGHGFMDMADFAVELAGVTGGRHSEIAIVSGNSCIIFRTPYSAGVRQEELKGRRLQWFNDKNDVRMPPSDRHVLRLPVRLPGTVISMRVCLGEGMIQESAEV